MKNKVKLNKKGFISSTIIITFVVLFLLLMLALLEKYISTRRNVQKSAEDIRLDLNAKVRGKDGNLLYSIIANKYENMIASAKRGGYTQCPRTTSDMEYCVNNKKSDSYEVYKFTNDRVSYNSPIYFFWHKATHNNVVFAGKCWKMIRTTETGGVKLLYSGNVNPDGTCKTITDPSGYGGSHVAYNNETNNKKTYVGYTYPVTGNNNKNSKLKETIDTCLNSSIKAYSYFLEDATWCNDRSEVSQNGGGAVDFAAKKRFGVINEAVITLYASERVSVYPNYKDMTSYTGVLEKDEAVDVYKSKVTWADTCSGGWYKIASGDYANSYVCSNSLDDKTSTPESGQPSKATLYCLNTEDNYTLGPIINYSRGNELLSSIGVSGATITADEVYLIYDNKDYATGRNYLADEFDGYWTMTPFDFTGSVANVYAIKDSGELAITNVHNATDYGVRPAVSLKYNTYVYDTVNGIKSDGSKEKPYHVITDLTRYITVNLNDDLFYATSDFGYTTGIRVDYDEDGTKALALDGKLKNNQVVNLFVNNGTAPSGTPFRMTIKLLGGRVEGTGAKLMVDYGSTTKGIQLPNNSSPQSITFTGIPKKIYINDPSLYFDNYKIDINLTRVTTELNEYQIFERYDKGWYKRDASAQYVELYNIADDLGDTPESKWLLPTDFRSGYTFRGYCSRRGGGNDYLVISPTGDIKSGKTTEYSYDGTLYAWWDKNVE